MEAVEAFLEVYFMKSDFLMKRLAVLREKIDDTEDLINIDLDFRRNELFKVDILLTSGTMATGLVAAIAGIFGMNLRNKFELSVAAFYGTTFGILLLCFGVAFFIYRWTKFRKIL